MLTGAVLLLGHAVAPLAGAWIEIGHLPDAGGAEAVAPLAGAWIEIMKVSPMIALSAVAPLAGAWIEMPLPGRRPQASGRRPPRGGVD